MIDKRTADWTYGAEHELADWDRRKWNVSHTKNTSTLPVGFGIDHKDITIVNSSGVAVDTTRALWPYGGEIKTPPSSTVDDQLKHLVFCRDVVKGRVNYRSNLHIHIRVPGLSTNLRQLKALQRYIMNNIGMVFTYVEPLWKVNYELRDKRDKQFGEILWTYGAKRRLRRCKVSHHTVIPPERVRKMLQAKTIHEFHDLEVPHDAKGRPMPHAQPRAAVNVRQLKQTDTIEFRHFPGTLDTEELANAFIWCREFLYAALYEPKVTAFQLYSNTTWNFPKWQPYQHWQELRYQATCSKVLSEEEVNRNIYKVLEGRFNYDTDCVPW